MTYHQVEGYGDLIRDSKTNAIINCNSLDYEKYVTSRKAKSEKTQKVLTIEEDLANLKNEMMEIKSLLKELANGK